MYVMSTVFYSVYVQSTQLYSTYVQNRPSPGKVLLCAVYQVLYECDVYCLGTIS